ncbi:MAG: hypothetical protein AB8F34_03275 [Akkermansiaceae bacterium]
MAILTGNLPTNPFDNAFEMLGRTPQVTTEEVNADALEDLTRALTSRASDRGRMILLRSPRAGFGKTHLLMRLHQRVAHTHEFIPLEPTKGKELDAQSVLDAVLRRFSRILPAGGGLTVLDLLARRILASGLEPLVKSGEVPSQDRETALQALQIRPVETFDFHNDEAVTAQWAKANFSLLGPRLTAELAERTHAGFRPVAWWVELLFRYSSAPVDQTTRNSSLFETVFSGDAVETDMHEKLVALLNLTGLVTSPVLILDEVEGFSSNPAAALQVATFLNALHQSCEKLALIISVNGDVWETAFLPRIPCGLKDRLSDIVVDLKPMNKEIAMKLIRDRAGDMADSIAEELDFESGVVYARGVVRCASSAWPELAVYENAVTDNTLAPKTEPISLSNPELSDQPAAVKPDLNPPKVVIPQETPPTEIEPVAQDSWVPGEPELVDIETALTEPDTIDPSEGFLPRPEDVSQQPASPQPQVERLQPAESEMPDLSNLPQPFAQQQDAQQQESPFEEVGQTPELSPVTNESFAPPADNIPQPFAQQQPNTPATEPLDVPPQNIVDSPFSIDTSSPVESPFTPVQPEPRPQFQSAPSPEVAPPVQPVSSEIPQAQPIASPETEPHSVTDDDHEKVEDLLKQFRERYGRD